MADEKGEMPDESGEKPNGEGETQTTDQTTTEPTMSLEDAQKLIKERTDEAIKNRKEAAAWKKKVEEFEKAQLSEKELLEKEKTEAIERANEAERKYRESVIDSKVTALASRLGFVDPSDASIALNRSTLELDENGEVKDLEARLTELAKAKPYLLKKGRSIDGGAGATSSPTPPDMNAILRKEARI